MPESKRGSGSDLAKLDATTDDEIARQIAEDPDTAAELTDECFDKADIGCDKKPGRPRAGRSAVGASEQRHNLADAIRRRVEPLGGIELPPVPRGPLREPPDFT